MANANADINTELVPLLEVVYSAKDFPSFNDAMLRRMREKFPNDYNDIVATAIAVMQIHVQAYGLSQLSWNLDRVAADSFLVTSRTLAAATRHTEQLNYKIPAASPATGDFLCAVNPADMPVQATLDKGHNFEGPGGRIFQATDTVIVPAASSSFSANVTEGEERELAFVSSGEANQRFSITGVSEGLYLAVGSVVVTVDGASWTQNDFFVFETTDQFVVEFTADPPQVIFGNGFAGNIPVVDGAIAITYRIIRAEEGNIASVTDPATTTVRSVDPFTVAGVPVTLTVTAPNGAGGGTPPQELAEVKVIAPKAFNSRGASITPDDYEALGNSFQDPTFGAVAVSFAGDVRNTGNDAETIQRTSAINAEMSTLVTESTNAQTVIDVDQADIDAQVALLDAEVVTQGTISTSISASSVTVRTNADIVGSEGVKVEANVTSIESAIIDLSAAIAASSASTTEKSGMDNILAQISDLVGGATGISTLNSTIKAAGSALVTESETIGAIATGLTTSTANVSASSSAISTSSASLQTQSSDLLVDSQSAQTNVAIEVSALLLHLDDLFDSDCMANVVNVPILALGVDGFYTGPSTGLIRSVQIYFDGIKEVTQHVNVVSGATSLLAADLTIRYKVSNTLQSQQVATAIDSETDNLLKGRAFADPLYLSAPDKKSGIYDRLNRIDGLLYIAVTITGPANRLDVDGNLIPLELEIVTKGTITKIEVT